MHAILDEQLYAYADRVDGKVVLITGAAAGIGRETALLFAKHGAKVVIGDRDVAGAEKVVAEIAQRGGEATYKGCDVCVWDDQVDLFDHAVAKYASVDIVIPNAGVGEVGKFTQVALDSNGRPVQPKLATIQVNLVGLIYTTHLALHYLKVNFPPGSLKAVVMLGSMASWQAVPAANLYTATKHAVLGLMRSLSLKFGRDGIRIGCIHPFFAGSSDSCSRPRLVMLTLIRLQTQPSSPTRSRHTWPAYPKRPSNASQAPSCTLRPILTWKQAGPRGCYPTTALCSWWKRRRSKWACTK